jgi:ribokinase
MPTGPKTIGIVTILGCFNADLVFAGHRLPQMGETIMGSNFSIHAGGKGSNQAIAARRAGAEVRLITALGKDSFADDARSLYAKEGISDQFIQASDLHPTGTAFVFVEDGSGENAIIVGPGAASHLGAADIETVRPAFEGTDVFLSQNEVPIAAVQRGLALARENGATTLFNPAPAGDFENSFLALCDIVTPNRLEASALANIEVATADDAQKAARIICERGAGSVVITLGADGALYFDSNSATHIAAPKIDRIVDTTGAGDAFNGAFAAALAAGNDRISAISFGTAAGTLAVTKSGAAPSMPRRTDIDALNARKKN